MNLFELFVKIGVDDQASKNISNVTQKLGNGLKTAAKIGTAAVSAAAAGITALTTAAVKNYAEYEQLVGGVETLFKKSSDTVMKYASEAYRSAGMSANEYMSTVTGFSASLLQGLGGDTQKAAEIANLAVTDMADNANKMGTSMELIQNAYQGFAKDNFTMLDNLKLGYGGTAGEMARLINDSGVLGDAIEVTNKTVADVPFDKVIEAINTIQTRMGITGTTAFEAGQTISGSVGAMKSAWTNLVTGFADGNADIEGLINNLVTTIVGDGTENNLGVLGNILPAVETALGGIVKLIEGAVPKLVEMLPGLVGKILPAIISAAVSVVNSLSQALPDLLSILINSIMTSMPLIISGIVTAFQAVVEMLPELIQQIADALPTLVPQIIVGMVQMVVILVKNLPRILASLVSAFLGLFEGAWQGIKKIFSLDKVGDFFSGIWKGIKNAFGSVADWFKNIFSKAWEGVKNVFSSGGKIFSGIKDGIVKVFKTVVNGIIKGINKVVALPFKAINAVLKKLKSIEILGVSPFGWIKTFNVPQIPYLYQGGILKKGQVGILEGKGAEWVVPLEEQKGWMDKLSNNIVDKMGVSSFGGSQDVNITIGIEEKANALGLARALLPFLKIAEREVYA